MVKRKRSSRSRQVQQVPKSKSANNDKRKRLATPNGQRRSTDHASVPLGGGIATLIDAISQMLDRRIRFRLPIVLAGAMLAGGRRTAASWFRRAGVLDDWDRFYDLLQAIGKNAALMMLTLLTEIVRRFGPDQHGCWKIGLDDSPTKRFGPCVEGANIHHNPTPGPGDGKWIYGHSWVCLSVLLRHSRFGVIALPLLSYLYVRKVGVEAMKARIDWEFRTKHELALELYHKIIEALRSLNSKALIIAVFDGAYLAAALVRPLVDEGVVVVTRLRCNAKLFDVPPSTEGKRGRPRKYGRNRINLKKRAENRRGWQTISYASRGKIVERHYKTFLATSPVFGGQIRVVLLEYSKGQWAAYVCSDCSMGVERILETVADRWSIEEQFHDVKELWGAGHQQVRNIWSSIGCWNICSWLYTLVELECWDDSSEELVDRHDRPWDDPTRRPSHNDRRRKIARKMLKETFFRDLKISQHKPKIRTRIEQLLSLAA